MQRVELGETSVNLPSSIYSLYQTLSGMLHPDFWHHVLCSTLMASQCATDSSLCTLPSGPVCPQRLYRRKPVITAMLVCEACPFRWDSWPKHTNSGYCKCQRGARLLWIDLSPPNPSSPWNRSHDFHLTPTAPSNMHVTVYSLSHVYPKEGYFSVYSLT